VLKKDTDEIRRARFEGRWPTWPEEMVLGGCGAGRKRRRKGERGEEGERRKRTLDLSIITGHYLAGFGDLAR